MVESNECDVFENWGFVEGVTSDRELSKDVVSTKAPKSI